MPRTRSQAVVSPLVSLDTPRRKRKAPTTTTNTSSVGAQDATKTKVKRGRKTTKKATVTEEKTSEEKTRAKSETIETHETQVTQEESTQEALTQKETPLNGTTPKHIVQEEQIQENLQRESPIAKAAKDNGSSIPPTTPKWAINSESSTPDSYESAASILFSSIKRRTIKKALVSVKDALKKPARSIRERLFRMRSLPLSNGDVSQTATAPATDTESSYQTAYSLAEDEILDAALDIVLHRMENNTFQPDPFVSSSYRCPCCQGALKLECPEGHDLHTWIPDRAKEAMNAVLTTLFAEGIIMTSEEKENARQSQKEAEIERQAEEQRKISIQNKKKMESITKPKSKKRTRESPDDSHNDEAPKAQRPRLTTEPDQSPTKRRSRRTTTTPRRRLPFAEIRRRAAERENGIAPPSMFRLDEAIAQHEAQEATRKAAEEVAETERLQSIRRAAMERHAILGPIPDDVHNTFEVPVFDDGLEDNEAPEVTEAAEAPQTPNANAWGFNIHNFFTSVTGSVRRLVPQFRPVTDQAVPFVAGGDETPIVINGAVPPPAELNDTMGDDTDMDLSYSLFPAPMELPQILSDTRPAVGQAPNHVSDEATSSHVPPLSKETTNGDVQNLENGTTLAIGEDKVQNQLTQNSSQNANNIEIKDADTQVEPENGSKKRKRAPSPDSIPNPPGCSYGMDLDYFTYSDDELEEAEAITPLPSALKTTSTTSATAKHVEKKARFCSPEQEPSNVQQMSTIETTQHSRPYQPYTPPGWARPTTTVYRGEMFKGRESPRTPTFCTPQEHESRPFYPKQDTARPQSKVYPASGSLLELRKEQLQKRKSFRVEPEPEPESSTPCNSLKKSVNTGPLTETLRQNLKRNTGSRFLSTPGLSGHELERQLQQSPQPSQQSAQQLSQQPSQQLSEQPIEQTPQKSPQKSSAISKVANKPEPEPEQQPAINAASNSTSSQDICEDETTVNNTATTKSNIYNDTTPLPPIQPISAALRGQPVTERSRPKNPSRLRNRFPLSSSPLPQGSPAQNSDEKGQEDLLQVFGNDEFGHEAYDIYKSCPSGDLSKVQWPGFDSLPEDTIQQFANSKPMDKEQQRDRHVSFQESFEQFQNEFDQGLIDPDEVLSNLPL